MDKPHWRAVLVAGLIGACVTYIIPRVDDEGTWTPDPYSPTIEYRQKRWFGQERTLLCTWRRMPESTDPGCMSWCTRGPNGHWYTFVVERDRTE